MCGICRCLHHCFPPTLMVTAWLFKHYACDLFATTTVQILLEVAGILSFIAYAADTKQPINWCTLLRSAAFISSSTYQRFFTFLLSSSLDLYLRVQIWVCSWSRSRFCRARMPIFKKALPPRRWLASRTCFLRKPRVRPNSSCTYHRNHIRLFPCISFPPLLFLFLDLPQSFAMAKQRRFPLVSSSLVM